ncbi:DUF5348 domain-containing protein [Clostridium thailandense]|uniref:DUF5348 domain-containing protein n=1 Tax=Clostridium thailandense TaxID=2794346 RepID=UPI0039892494
MDKQYTNSIFILEKAKREIEHIINTSETKSFDDKKAQQILSGAIENIESSVLEIKHFSKDTKQGSLYKLSNGKWAFDTEYEKEIYFSCGYPAEIFNEKENQWDSGRIEHTNGEYYFFNYDERNLELYEGMLVRVRVGNL